jgi:hypothetical protein
MKDTGGPEFSVVIDMELTVDWSKGMTLRDYFAAKVLAGMWTNSELLATLKRGQESEEIAMAAYEQADAMLKARQP